MNAGATMIPGLNSNIAIPKNNSDVSATFIAEGSAITESDIDVDTITLTPKLCAGTASFSKQVLQTTSPKVDELVQEGLQLQIMNRIDDSALNGNGSAPNPTGVANTTGINTKVTAGNSTMTHAESLEIIASVASNNLDTSGGVFLLHPNDAATIGSTSKDSGSGTFVYENGLIAGKRVIETTHATEGTAFFGIFRHLMIGMFGGLDIVIDPYSSSRSGIVHITATQLTDVAVAYEKAFSKITLTA
jgi:HK97 family phage major capsid protein